MRILKVFMRLLGEDILKEPGQTWFRFKDPIRWDMLNLRAQYSSERFPERLPYLHR